MSLPILLWLSGVAPPPPVTGTGNVLQAPQDLSAIGVVGGVVGTGSRSVRVLRTYGRIPKPGGGLQWVEVTTDINGFNDNVYLTTLAQTLKLSLGESPFFANYGIPAQQSVVTQVFPDYYVAQTQMQFAPYFSSLTITRRPESNPPIYDVLAVTHSGAIITREIAL